MKALLNELIRSSSRSHASAWEPSAKGPHPLSRRERGIFVHLIIMGSLLMSLVSGVTVAATSPFNDTVHGIACDWYDSATKSKWQRRQGDWQDAQGQAWGDQPFGPTVRLTRKDPVSFVELDVTPIVQLWLTNAAPNQGLLLKPVALEEGSATAFFSREAPELTQRPVLQLWLFRYLAEQ